MDKKILAIDTSTKACSVAICSFTVEDDKIAAFNVLFQSVCNIKITHSQTAMPIIEDALKNSFIKIDDIDYFASSRGPGSFTGLRIGISIIKGLAMSFDENIKNVASVDTLLALAYNKFDFNGIIISCLDARNNKVFCSIYDNTFKKMEALEENLNIDITQLCEKLQKFEKNIIFVGDGAKLCYNTMKEKNNNKVFLSEEYFSHPFASAIAYCGAKSIVDGQAINADELIPLYIQIPQAQRELEAKLNFQNK